VDRGISALPYSLPSKAFLDRWKRSHLTISRRIEVSPFSASAPPKLSHQNAKHRSTRNWNWVLGVAGTLLIHGLAIQSFALGSSLHKPPPPEMRGAGALRINAATAPTGELVLVTIAVVRKEDSDLAEQIASFGPQLEKVPISILSPDPLPAMDIDTVDEATETSEQMTPKPDDPAAGALMFGRYMGQISARIERAWVRPRSPVNEVAQMTSRSEGIDGSSASADDTFSCRVQIRQDARGNVQEVLLLQCNGSEPWRHSLVVAINQSSPLPAPPIPNVFTQVVTMSFEANPYHPGSPPDLYEMEPRAGVKSLADFRPAENMFRIDDKSTLTAESHPASAQ
jgi:hypothetical protein